MAGKCLIFMKKRNITREKEVLTAGPRSNIKAEYVVDEMEQELHSLDHWLVHRGSIPLHSVTYLRH